jgi:hypothetical protein
VPDPTEPRPEWPALYHHGRFRRLVEFVELLGLSGGLMAAASTGMSVPPSPPMDPNPPAELLNPQQTDQTKLLEAIEHLNPQQTDQTKLLLEAIERLNTRQTDQTKLLLEAIERLNTRQTDNTSDDFVKLLPEAIEHLTSGIGEKITEEAVSAAMATVGRFV